METVILQFVLEKQNREYIRGAKMRKRGENLDFVAMILNNLRVAGMQQIHKEDRIEFSSLERCPSKFIESEGLWSEASEEESIEKQARIFIGPEYGTVSRVDLITASKGSTNGSFDVLVARDFSYDAQEGRFG